MYKNRKIKKNSKSGSFESIKSPIIKSAKKALFSTLLAIIFIISSCILSSAQDLSASASASLSLGTHSVNSTPSVNCNNPKNGKRVMLYAGGMPFGVRFNTDGLIVSAISDVPTRGGIVCPCKGTGLTVGDIISKVNGKKVGTPSELVNIINEDTAARTVALTVMRGTGEKEIIIRPQKSIKDGKNHLGLFVRNKCAGIGTVSFISEDKTSFAGLGHGICDRDSGALIPFLSGEVTDAHISEIVKGKCGAPGELRGSLSGNSRGSLTNNLHTGIYGKFSSAPEDLYYSSPLPAAFKNEVKEGEAHILCTLDSGKIEKYTISIEKINFDDKYCKNYGVKITDERLLDKTGGIVQGMSGSPIIQDGKIIGALTHVLVDDPTCGYGIFIGNMLDAAQMSMAKTS